MMENHVFCDHCPGCRPAVLDVATGEPIPDTDPRMVEINRYWDKETSFEQRKGFIEVTLHNSRKPSDLAMFEQIARKIQKAMGGS